MTREEILKNGYLEAYLLGELSGEELKAFETTLRSDAELREKLADLELHLETMAFENAIEPPPTVKKSLKNTLEKPRIVLPYRPDLWAAAALAALFAISAFGLFMRWQNTQEKLELLQENHLFVRSQLEETRMKINAQENILQRVSAPGVVPVFLRGNEKVTEFEVVVYLDETNGKVWLNTANLPAPPRGKSYQMWGDVDEHMVSMGIVNAQKRWQTLTYLPDAGSLNVTLEPEGGSEEASVDQLLAQTIIP